MIKLLAIIAALFTLTTACEVPTQIEGTVLVEGDSLTRQWIDNNGDLIWENGIQPGNVHAGYGWRADWCGGSWSPCYGYGPAVDNVRGASLEDHSVDTLVWLMGNNDASPHQGGWTFEDEQTWNTVFRIWLNPDSCLVYLTLYNENSPEMQAEFDKANAYMERVRDTRPNTHIVYWDGYTMESNEKVLAEDGMHLADTRLAIERRADAIEAGMRMCDE